MSNVKLIFNDPKSRFILQKKLDYMESKFSLVTRASPKMVRNIFFCFFVTLFFQTNSLSTGRVSLNSFDGPESKELSPQEGLGLMIHQLFKRGVGLIQENTGLQMAQQSSNIADLQDLFRNLFGNKSLFAAILRTLLAFINNNIPYFSKLLNEPLIAEPGKGITPFNFVNPLYFALKTLGQTLFAQ